MWTKFFLRGEGPVGIFFLEKHHYTFAGWPPFGNTGGGVGPFSTNPRINSVGIDLGDKYFNQLAQNGTNNVSLISPGLKVIKLFHAQLIMKFQLLIKTKLLEK